jgi:hypothetical protein
MTTDLPNVRFGPESGREPARAFATLLNRRAVRDRALRKLKSKDNAASLTAIV